MSSEKSVRVKEIVEHVRTQRSGMVQTEAQYKFLYDIIPHIVQAQNTVSRSAADLCKLFVWYTIAAVSCSLVSRRHQVSWAS